jgi:hypothetical protein
MERNNNHGKLEPSHKDIFDALDEYRRERRAGLYKMTAILLLEMLGLAIMMAYGFGWI